MLIALRMKGETAEEMIGAARALSAAALPFERPDYLFADCCGTGGDGSGATITVRSGSGGGMCEGRTCCPVAPHEGSLVGTTTTSGTPPLGELLLWTGGGGWDSGGG